MPRVFSPTTLGIIKTNKFLPTLLLIMHMIDNIYFDRSKINKWTERRMKEDDKPFMEEADQDDERCFSEMESNV